MPALMASSCPSLQATQPSGLEFFSSGKAILSLFFGFQISADYARSLRPLNSAFPDLIPTNLPVSPTTRHLLNRHLPSSPDTPNNLYVHDRYPSRRYRLCHRRRASPTRWVLSTTWLPRLVWATRTPIRRARSRRVKRTNSDEGRRGKS